MNLKELINASQSMDWEEKQYWIDILPNMNENQLNRLKDILKNELESYKKVDEKYKYEKNAKNKKDMLDYINS